MDVTATHDYFVKMNDREYKLVMKGLALVAGIKVTVDPLERKPAAEMNKRLLEQRVAVLQEQLRVASGALEQAETREIQS